MYNDFDFDNIAVSHEKEIFLVDYEELNVIENTDFDETNGELAYLRITLRNQFLS